MEWGVIGSFLPTIKSSRICRCCHMGRSRRVVSGNNLGFCCVSWCTPNTSVCSIIRVKNYIAIFVTLTLLFPLLSTLCLSIKLILFNWKIKMTFLIVIDWVRRNVNVPLSNIIDSLKDTLNISPSESWKIYDNFPLICLWYTKLFVQISDHGQSIFMLLPVSDKMLVIVMSSRFVVPKSIFFYQYVLPRFMQ